MILILGDIHRQNCSRACSGLLLKRWNCHCERYFSHQWALAGIGQILPHSQGWSLKNWKLRELPSGCLDLKFIFYCSGMGGQSVNSKARFCSAVFFYSWLITSSLHFISWTICIHNSLSFNCGISKLPGKIQSWKIRVLGFSDNFLI